MKKWAYGTVLKSINELSWTVNGKYSSISSNLTLPIR